MNFEQFHKSLQKIEQDLVDFFSALMRMNRPKEILEVGSGWGIFSRTAAELSDAKVTTIDKIGGYGRNEFAKNTAGFENKIEQIIADSHELLPKKQTEWKHKFDIVFVDGDHTPEGALKDIRDSWDLVAPGGFMLVDDVFHKLNWELEPKDPSKFEFGVAKALWGFMQDHYREFYGLPFIVPIAHGLILIDKYQPENGILIEKPDWMFRKH